jgi:hypothetical protein
MDTARAEAAKALELDPDFTIERLRKAPLRSSATRTRRIASRECAGPDCRKDSDARFGSFTTDAFSTLADQYPLLLQ